jgi:hypothetical protein
MSTLTLEEKNQISRRRLTIEKFRAYTNSVNQIKEHPTDCSLLAHHLAGSLNELAQVVG